MCRDKMSMRKHFEQLRFVFLFSFVLCLASLFFLHHGLLHNGQSGITFLLVNFTYAKHGLVPKPSSFSGDSSGTIGCPTKPTNLTNEKASNGKGNKREQMGPTLFIGNNIEPVAEHPNTNLDPCYGKYVYMYDLPSRFNVDLVKNCHSLLKWFDMCPYMVNLGLGPKVNEKPRGKMLLKKDWYVTNQFSLDVIFHNNMKNYKCLTKNSSLASAIYVPYYAGFDVGQYLWGGYNVSIRDASPKALVKWLAIQPEWKRMWGRDHFMVGGRIGFDYRRRTDDDSDWGTKLMFLPEASNMSMLSIESASYDNDFPIPYPTYFHPSSDNEVLKWQRRMRRVKRPYLFSFAGAPRPNSSNSLRNELITHCKSSRSCNFLGCFDGGNNCEDPVNVIKVFQSSVFCLQPSGDSWTRRSTFDSILAGCIPVFFHPSSAYEQYLWHLPKNGSKYSVFIPEEDVNDNRVIVNETLFRVPKSEVLAMRSEVIRLIPRIIYANPSSRLKTIEDALDIAVKGILGRIKTIRREIMKVQDSGHGYLKHTNSYSGDKENAE